MGSPTACANRWRRVGISTSGPRWCSGCCRYGPDAFMPALVAAIEDVNLHRDAWAFCLAQFERPFAEELARVELALLDHFRTHGVDAKQIWRDLASRQAAPATGRAAAGDPSASPTAAGAAGGTGGGGPGFPGGLG